VWRVIRRVFTAVAIVLATALVTLLSIDIGPWLRETAEQRGAQYLKRDFHIGRLSARLLRGHFVVEDLRIGGLSSSDRPFFTAKQIVVKIPWGSLIRREIVIQSIDLTDWNMVVEQFKDGRHSFPKFVPDDDGKPKGERRFHTTVQLVRASRGQFTYDDHEAPWSIVAPNLEVIVSKTDEYRGEAMFKDGLVRIARFEPMWAHMHSKFKIDDGKVFFDRMELNTDGATSIVTGTTDLGHWPEQIYYMRSRVNFPRMREIFFAHDNFRLGGEGNFVGSFHLYKGGRKLEGRFTSEETRLNDWRFPGLDGALVWERDRFEVTNAASGFYGGKMLLDFSMKPLGDAVKPARGRLDVKYEHVDLTKLTDAIEMKGMRLAGNATGRNLLEWPVGQFRERAGEGEIAAEPPSGMTLQSRTRAGAGPEGANGDLSATRGVSGASPRDVANVLASLGAEETRSPQHAANGSGKFALGAQGDQERRLARAARAARAAREAAFDPVPFREPVAVGGHLKYRYTPEWIDVEPGWAATRRTYVEVQGRTAYGERSQIPFHVTSSDWQESDRVLAAVIGAFGSPTHAIAFGGSGTFDGSMTGAFRGPRVEGHFTGDRVRAWDVEWGHTDAQIVIEHAYADVTNGVITRGDSRIDVEGRYSLGFPRDDNGDEINGRVRMTRRAIGDLKHAFDLDEYRLNGLLTGEFHLYGKYTRPFGFGRMTIDRGTSYGESFDTASAGLRFEGTGVRLDGLRMAKGAGDVSGAAYVDWQGHYSFNADGRRIPVEKIDALAYPSMPLFGVLTFTASGSGTFDTPRYDVRGRIDDLFIQDEGIGQVTGQLTVRGDVLTIDQFEAASPRLAVSGVGRINLAGDADADLTLRLTNTSIDPYARIFNPQLSPFTTAIASGTIHAKGALRDLARLRVDGRIEDVDLRLFDYKLRNDGPITLTLADNVARIDRLRVVGQGTTMELLGEVGLGTNRVRIRALGDANLSILQGFMRDIRSSGAAQVQAEITGPFDAPAFVGSAMIADGRLRYFGLPHSLESVNGRVEFDASGVRLDGLMGRMGGGEVRISGRIGTKGATINSYALTAVGRDMRVRYPEGFRSLIDADIALRGASTNPTLTGTVHVKDALFVRTIDTDTADVFGLAAVSGSKPGGAGAPAPAASSASSAFPLRFDVRIDAPSSLRIENSTARLVSSADLTLRGSYDKPLLFGRAEINRGEVFFEGNRYLVTRGTIDFSNPSRIDPFFDIEAETRARVPGETYRVTFRVTGTRERFVWDLTSDPPLATVDILALLFGEVRNTRDAEVRALRYREQTEQELFATRAARLLTSPISSEVNRVVKKTFGVDSVQIAPSIGDISGQESARITPTARLTIGKRISDRLFLTYAQPLTSSRQENLVLVEYTQSDRFAWIVSRNEDETYALDVRVRHVF
jgi:autotransporter translocation and assembly factor TamB